MDYDWVKIDAWHASDRDNPTKTLCGLSITTVYKIADQLPHGEKSCENCLRFIEWREEPVVN